MTSENLESEFLFKIYKMAFMLGKLQAGLTILSHKYLNDLNYEEEQNLIMAMKNDLDRFLDMEIYEISR